MEVWTAGNMDGWTDGRTNRWMDGGSLLQSASQQKKKQKKTAQQARPIGNGANEMDPLHQFEQKSFNIQSEAVDKQLQHTSSDSAKAGQSVGTDQTLCLLDNCVYVF